jgi:hypothetical protein
VVTARELIFREERETIVHRSLAVPVGLIVTYKAMSSTVVSGSRVSCLQCPLLKLRALEQHDRGQVCTAIGNEVPILIPVLLFCRRGLSGIVSTASV